MTQVYDDSDAIPVTVIEIPENIVCKVGKKSESGIVSIDIGIGEKKKAKKAEKGKYLEIKKVPRHIWTVWIEGNSLSSGKTFGTGECSVGDIVAVTGITKAKGFAGVVKRWGFAGGPRTHGQSDRERAPGSIGGGTDPGRVLPGKKMPGRMGGGAKTLYNRVIVGVGNDYILVRGSLPGNTGSLLKVEIEKKNED